MSEKKLNNDIVELGKNTRFSSTRQPKKRRKPSKWKKFVKEYDITPKDREYMAQVILSVKTKEDIEKVMKDNKDLPFGIYTALVAALSDAKKGGTGFLKYLYDAAFGKLPETIITKTDDSINDEDIPEEIEKIKEEIRKEERAKLIKEMENEKNNTD
jgi:hypothetical protein